MTKSRPKKFGRTSGVLALKAYERLEFCCVVESSCCYLYGALRISPDPKKCGIMQSL